MNEVTKLQVKALKQQQRAFKKLFNKVRARVRKLKVDVKDRRVLIKDLESVNIDLMYVLVENGPFKDVADYFDTINAYLRSEVDVYKYNVPLYLPSKMGEIMEIIRKFHNKQDRYDYLRSQIMEL